MLFLTIIFMVLTLLSPADLIPDLAPYRPMMIITILGALAVIVAAALRPTYMAPRQTIFMTAFCAMIMMSWPLHGWFGGVVVPLQLFSASSVIFFLCLVSLSTPSRLYWFSAALVMVALYYFVRTSAAVHFGINADKLIIYDWSDQVDPWTGEQLRKLRVVGLGLLSDPNDLGQLMLFSIALLSLGYHKAQLIRKVLIVPIVVALFYTIYLTNSRGTMIGLAVLIVLALKDRLGRFAPIAGGGLVAILLFVLGFGGGRGDISMQSGTSGSRIALWSDSIGLIKEHPILGIAFDNILSELEQTCHNSFLLCFVELGIFGYLIWVALLVLTFHQLRQVLTLKDRGPEGLVLARMGRAVYMAFVSIMVTCFFLSRTYSFLIYVLLGMAAAVVGMAHRKFPDLPGVNWTGLGRDTALASVGILVTVYVMVRLHWG